MNSYNKRFATPEEIKLISPLIEFFHYNKKNKIVISKDLTDNEKLELVNDIKSCYVNLTYILSEASKRIYKFQQGDETLKYFMEKGWKSLIVTNTKGFGFIVPEQFTQEFIDSKEGKRFKDKKPCAYMFMRALQSQKTIMEQLQVKEV